jgi:hypothetical protein
MRAATDCKHRAEECRRLAKLATKMSQTWELLAKQHQQEKQLAETGMAGGFAVWSRNKK